MKDFNGTLEEEFIDLGNYNFDPAIFKRNLTEWLIEYIFYRPHEFLCYKIHVDNTYLSLMCLSNTIYCFFLQICYNLELKFLFSGH